MKNLTLLFSLLFSLQVHTQVYALDQVALPGSDPSDAFLYQLKESLVKISSSTKSGGHGYGTGVAISKDLIVTNCHVIQNSNGVSISKWGEAFGASALFADWKHDLCILRVEWANLKPVNIGDSELLSYEQPIISISMPGDSPAPFVSLSKIKALYPADDAHIIRASSAFAIGASGSPVFDYDGNLIGISTFKSPGKNAYFYNMPSKWIKSLLKTTEVKLNATHEPPFWDTPEEERPFFMRVVMPYQNGRWQELKAVAQQWVMQEPKNVEALFYAGIAEENLGDLSKANQYYQQVLQLKPQHSATLMQLGLMANRMGNAVEVEKNRIALKSIDQDLEQEYAEALLKTH